MRYSRKAFDYPTEGKTGVDIHSQKLFLHWCVHPAQIKAATGHAPDNIEYWVAPCSGILRKATEGQGRVLRGPAQFNLVH